VRAGVCACVRVCVCEREVCASVCECVCARARALCENKKIYTPIHTHTKKAHTKCLSTNTHAQGGGKERGRRRNLALNLICKMEGSTCVRARKRCQMLGFAFGSSSTSLAHANESAPRTQRVCANESAQSYKQRVRQELQRGKGGERRPRDDDGKDAEGR
jgi:hypothetical protein